MPPRKKAIRTLPEIITAAEKAAKGAPIGELQHVYELIRDLTVQVSNAKVHVKRLELKVGGKMEGWGGE